MQDTGSNLNIQEMTHTFLVKKIFNFLQHFIHQFTNMEDIVQKRNGPCSNS